jgi:integrase
MSADKPQKPEKPRKDFPLFPHDGGVWAKKIKGKFYYFGPWSDPQGAYKKYQEEFPYLQAGHTPPSRQEKLGDLLNAFLGDKEARFKTGDISRTTYKEYEAGCDAISAALNKDRPIETIGPEDFANLRTKLAIGKDGQTYSPVTLKRRLTIARMAFAYGNEEMGLALRFKRGLQAPSRRTIRRKEREREKRLYTSPDIRKLVSKADPHLRAMTLLGINCGFGPHDCETLPADALDLKGGWHNYARPKTEVERRCPLWPETAKALKALEFDKHVFNGRKWSRHVIAREFDTLCETCKVKNHGFYSLRRTFETIATTAKVSQAVIDHVMGHSRNDMASTYRQEIFDSQLRECVEHVRQWYLGKVTV